MIVIIGCIFGIGVGSLIVLQIIALLPNRRRESEVLARIRDRSDPW